MSSAVSLNGLSKNYGSFQALKPLSFQMKEGECMGLLGPNGAGKSTTIHILTGQLQPSSGDCQVFGIDPALDPKAVHSLIGFIPDSLSLYDDLTVEQNIELFRRLYKEPKKRTAEIIERMNLKDKTQARAKTLSKGLKQRLLIARTLVHIPKILFLDEPTTALDPDASDFICQFLEDLKAEGVTLFLSSHLMALAERLCDRIVFLNKGEKAAEGGLQELKRKYGSSQTEVTVLEEGRRKKILIPFDRNLPSELEKIQQSKEIVSVKTHETGLEDIFIQLVRSNNS